MKTFLFITFLAIGPVLLHAQTDVITTYFKKYENDTAFTRVTVSGKMFSLLTQIEGETPEEKEMLKTIGKLSGLKVLVNDHAKNPNALYQQAIKTPIPGFEVLMTVQDQDENLTFYIHEQGGIVKDLLLIGTGKEEFFLMNLSGDIDLKQVSKLSHALNIGGLDKFDNVKTK